MPEPAHEDHAHKIAEMLVEMTHDEPEKLERLQRFARLLLEGAGGKNPSSWDSVAQQSDRALLETNYAELLGPHWITRLGIDPKTTPFSALTFVACQRVTEMVEEAIYQATQHCEALHERGTLPKIPAMPDHMGKLDQLARLFSMMRGEKAYAKANSEPISDGVRAACAQLVGMERVKNFSDATLVEQTLQTLVGLNATAVYSTEVIKTQLGVTHVAAQDNFGDVDALVRRLMAIQEHVVQQSAQPKSGEERCETCNCTRSAHASGWAQESCFVFKDKTAGRDEHFVGTAIHGPMAHLALAQEQLTKIMEDGSRHCYRCNEVRFAHEQRGPLHKCLNFVEHPNAVSRS